MFIETGYFPCNTSCTKFRISFPSSWSVIGGGPGDFLEESAPSPSGSLVKAKAEAEIQLIEEAKARTKAERIAREEEEAKLKAEAEVRIKAEEIDRLVAELNFLDEALVKTKTEVEIQREFSSAAREQECALQQIKSKE